MSDTIAVDYVFNVKPAQDNIVKLSNAFGGLDTKTKESMQNAAKMSQSINVGSKIGAGAVAVGNLMSGGIMKLIDLVVTSLPKIMDWIKSLGVDIDGMLAPFKDVFKPVLEEIGGWIKSNSAGIKKLFGFFAGAAAAATQIVMTAFGTLKNFVMAVFDGIFTKGKFTFDSFVNLMQLALLKIVFVITFIQILLEPLFMAIGKLFNEIYKNVIEPFFQGLMSQFDETFGLGIEDVKDFFTALTGFINSIDTSGLKETFTILGQIAGFFIKYLSLPALMIRGFMTLFDLFKKGSEILSNINDFIWELDMAVMNFFRDISSGAGKAFGFIKIIIGKIFNGNIFQNFVTKSKEILGNFTNWVTGKFEDVKKWIFEKFNGNPFSNFIETAKNKFNEFKSIVKSIIDSIFVWFSEIPGKIKASITSGINIAKEAIKGTWIGNIAEKIGVIEKPEALQPEKPAPVTTASNITNQPITSTTNNSNVVTVNVNGSTNPQATAQAVAREIEKRSIATDYNKTKIGKGM